jgi:hypothetical protein
MNISLPSSGLKSEPSKKQSEEGRQIFGLITQKVVHSIHTHEDLRSNNSYHDSSFQNLIKVVIGPVNSSLDIPGLQGRCRSIIYLFSDAVKEN